MEDRMDAGFYRPEYLNAAEKISSLSNLKTIEEIASIITNGATPLGPLYAESGIKFLRAENIRELGMDDSDVVYIYEKDHNTLARSALKNKDALLTIKGKVGDVAVVQDLKEETNINQDIAKIRLKNTIDYNPFYIAAFLASKIGMVETRRRATGAINPFLQLSELKKIKIPIPSPSFQSHIESIVKTAYEKRKEAQRKLQEAEEILEKELGWRELELNHDKVFETSFSHLERRFDPEYFKPRYEGIKEVLHAKNAKPLSEAVKVITKRADFRKTPDKIIKYVAIADVDPESSQIVSYTEMPAYQAPSRATYTIKEGYILTATSGNSTGTKRHASCFVTAKEDGFICTNGVVPLYPKEGTEPLYLLFYLKSPFFLEQVRRELTGAAIPAISLEDLKQILVYLPSIKIQNEIARLVDSSNKLRTESRDLINQAKREVEELIEKGVYGNESF